MSPLGFAVLSGAGLFGSNQFGTEGEIVHVHMTSTTTVSSDDTLGLVVDLSNALADTEEVDGTAPIYIMVAESDGSIAGDMVSGTFVVNNNEDGVKQVISGLTGVSQGDMVFVDYYVKKQEAVVDELQIDAEHFAGYYYVEADTLFRRQSDGKDLAAVLTFPNVKIQSNFTFTMAASGDPSEIMRRAA